MQTFLNGVDISAKYQPEELSAISLTLIADMAEVGTGQFPVPDATSTLSYFSGAEFQIHDGAIPILNGYIGADTVTRGTTAGGTRRVSGMTVADENAYLWGARAYNWHRPAETDRARVLAFAAKYMPDLDTTWVLNTHNKSLQAKTYITEEIVTDLLGDIADVTGKTMFVVNRSLHWHLYTEGDTAGLAISDDAAEYDYATTFPPENPSATRDPSELRNNELTYNDKGQTYRYKDSASLARYDSHIRHQGLASFPNATLASLESHAKGIVARAAQERVTYECDIGPLTAAQFALIPKGSLISVTSSVMGLHHSTQRVAQIDVKYKNPGQYFLHLTFAFPIRRVASPKPAPPVTKPTPYVPGGGAGTIVFIQAAKTADATAGGDATFASPATAGNFLVMATEPDQPGGATPAWDVYTDPGWIHDVESHGITDDSGAGTTLGRLIASKDADGGETLVQVSWAPAGGATALTPKNGMVVMAEYQASDNLILADPAPFIVQDDGLGVTTLPPVTPTPGATALIVWLVGFHPNYAPTVSAGWNIRGSWDSTGGSRLRLMLIDQIVDAAAGSYSGTLTSPGGTDSTGWVLGGAVYEMGGNVPVYGQPVGPESAISDGSTTQYQTSFPYQPGSLRVKVGGVTTVVTETDSESGLFTLSFPPAVGTLITWTYLGTDADPTGANNPPPPTSGPPPSGGPGTVLGGDGQYRQPSAMAVPAEAPDGTRTVFTIPPYIVGTTLLYINGLIQRLTTDYAETSPGTGVITLVGAPATTDNIVVVFQPARAILTRPFPAWTTGGTYTIPGSIDHTGATEVGALIDAWLATLPAYATADFGGDVNTFQCHQGIQIPAGRHFLYLWGGSGAGAKIKATSGTSGADQLNSQIIVGHQRGGSWAPAHSISDIVIDNFVLEGNNPSPGAFTSGTEGAANLEITGVDRIELKNVKGSKAWGDFLFWEDVTNGWGHDCHALDAGRDGVSVISGDTILMQQMAFDRSGQNVIDVEPNTSAQACYRVVLEDFTFGSFGNEFLGVEGTHTGAPIDTVTVTRGVGSGAGATLRSTIDNGGALGTQMKNISLTNCAGVGTIAGPVVDFHHVDNPTASGNTQALSSGAFASFASCTNPVV